MPLTCRRLGGRFGARAISGTASSKNDLIKAFLLCAKAYLRALCIAVLVGWAAGERHPIIIVFVADVAATFIIFPFARYF